MVVRDQRIASIVTARISAVIFGFLALPAYGAQTDAMTPAAAPVSLPGSDRTSAAAIDSTVGLDDTVTPSSIDRLTDGPSVAIHRAVAISLTVGAHTRTVRIEPTTVRHLLASQHVRLGVHDEISPSLDSVVAANDRVRVVRVAMWTAHVRQNIAARVRTRKDASLPVGRVVTIAKGRAGIRETTFRYMRRGNEKSIRVTLASRIVRQPQTRVIVRGIAKYASLAHVAEQGFSSAVNFAGHAIHMIATAYTAGCYGCSGITASGVRAGFGIIAVDPRVIPLGTKLFVPGYGRAVAGDTGGAIVGNRVDLGMNTQHDALRFGRRPITVYVLR